MLRGCYEDVTRKLHPWNLAFNKQCNLVPCSRGAATPYSWKGKRRPGIALDMRHRLQWFIHLQTQGLSKGHVHPTYTLLMEYGTLIYHRYRELTCRMGLHSDSVACHPTERTFPPSPQPIAARTLDLATPEGHKAELTYSWLVTYRGGTDGHPSRY